MWWLFGPFGLIMLVVFLAILGDKSAKDEIRHTDPEFYKELFGEEDYTISELTEGTDDEQDDTFPFI